MQGWCIETANPLCHARFGRISCFPASSCLRSSPARRFFGPFGPGGQPDPTIIQTAPRPDFFFLWLYAVLSFLPPAAETPLLMIGPVIAIALLLGLPFFAGEGEKSWRRRPVAVLTILLTAVALGAFTQLGLHTPWSPVMDAWSGDPIPVAILVKRTALERRGALVLQAKQCRNCHSLDGIGGRRGPALDSVAVRLTPSQLIRQVIQGGGNMPAYGKNLNPAETTALVAFLETLHPAGQAPARDAADEVADVDTWNVSREALKAIMSSVAGAALASWSIPFWATLGVLLAAILYIRGWRGLAYLRSTLLPDWRLACFLAGLASLWLAIASPLDAFGNFLLTAHMIQHLLMMVVAPPLILLGSPQNLLLRGLPRWAARDALGPFLSWRLLKRFGRLVTHPAFCWLAAAVALLAWHIPAAYDLALVSRGWHDLEHACLFGTSLLFWWPVVQPWPATRAMASLGNPCLPVVRRLSHYRSRSRISAFPTGRSTPRMPQYPGSSVCPNLATKLRRAPSCGFSVPSSCSAPR